MGLYNRWASRVEDASASLLLTSDFMATYGTPQIEEADKETSESDSNMSPGVIAAIVVGSVVVVVMVVVLSYCLCCRRKKEETDDVYGEKQEDYKEDDTYDYRSRATASTKGTVSTRSGKTGQPTNSRLNSIQVQADETCESQPKPICSNARTSMLYN
mmetsp:Transcript_9887/g.18990  ORF Transcript_9887/g.18990 Transcript_9887/m.18990 type:complete len:158 (-) Transcript_9887:226-699(-)